MKLAELVGIARPLEVARHGLVQRLDYIAARGYDVYLLDLRGYGKSARPKEMSEDPKTNPPIVRGDTAVKDIGTVVDFILARRNIQRLNLIGWSWGTVTMSTYSTKNPSK
jgi:pimeloyl-ACP methyl ester carboxylesterase